MASCSDDNADRPATLKWAVRASWQDGLAGGQSSRALAATDLLADVSQGAIAIAFEDYPAEISITCLDKDDQEIDYFILTNDNEACETAASYWSYTPEKLYTDMRIRSGNLKFLATAVIDGDPATTDDGDILESERPADKGDISHGHLHLRLRHTKALLRFAFQVDKKYDSLRSIMVKDILFNGQQCHVEQKVLNKTGMTYIAYCYIYPSEVDTEVLSRSNTIRCTYNIYDKDASFEADAKGVVADASITDNAPHLTRQDVIAQNTFTLSRIVFRSSAPEDQKLRPGYYYDLRVTLNPDYLYVLSEHDNKHMTIQ